jgi:hypothetical protein
VPGVGKVVPITLLIELPELGQLNRRKIAAWLGWRLLIVIVGRCEDNDQYWVVKSQFFHHRVPGSDSFAKHAAVFLGYSVPSLHQAETVMVTVTGNESALPSLAA